MEYLDTEDIPRATLNVGAAEAWLYELEELDRCWDQLDYHTRSTTPRIPANWNPLYDISDPSRPDPLPGIGQFVDAAQLAGVLTVAGKHPIEFIPAGTTQYFWRLRNTTGLTFTSSELLNAQSVGVNGSIARYAKIGLHILGEAVQQANRMLASTLQSAYALMAEQSTDTVLLTRLATYDDVNVRNGILLNPAAPTEAKVVLALRQ